MAIKNAKFQLNGVFLQHHKNTMELKAVQMPLPQSIRISMLQHMGVPCEPLVKKGDMVTVGQKIGDSESMMSVPIHSSVSGTVTGIDEVAASDGRMIKVVVIEPDGQQTLSDEITPPTVNNLADLIKAVRESGLVGLGGAGFPTHVKFGTDKLSQIDTLVINAAECEPYITSDYRTMMDFTDDVIEGIATIKNYLELTNAYIGVDDNKPLAIEKLNKAAAAYEGIDVVKLKSRYPQGAEKVMVYATTGRIIEDGELPADEGVVVMNISSVAFLASYLKTGVPLISRTITVDGGAVSAPQNVNVLIGTPIRDVIEFCGGDPDRTEKILMGGPMMGVCVCDVDQTILKNNNAILALDEKQARLQRTTACIKCGKCVGVCPVNLMPATLERAHDANDIDLLKQLHVNLCINCGCCSYVCPAKRNLAQKNQLSKLMIRQAKS